MTTATVPLLLLVMFGGGFIALPCPVLVWLLEAFVGHTALNFLWKIFSQIFAGNFSWKIFIEIIFGNHLAPKLKIFVGIFLPFVAMLGVVTPFLYFSSRERVMCPSLDDGDEVFVGEIRYVLAGNVSFTEDIGVN